MEAIVAAVIAIVAGGATLNNRLHNRINNVHDRISGLDRRIDAIELGVAPTMYLKLIYQPWFNVWKIIWCVLKTN